MNELRRLGVTTLFTLEERSPSERGPTETATMSALADTVINATLSRQDVVRRLIWIGKSRMSRCDLAVREVALGPGGLSVVDSAATSGEGDA